MPPNDDVGTPLRSYGAHGKRERPILELGPAGPLQARARVVPVTGLHVEEHAADTLFAVVVEWVGPPLPGLPPSDVDVDALDEVLVPDVDIARRLALAAFDLVREGRELVELRELHRAFKPGTEGALGRYRAAVGEGGIAAVHEHRNRVIR